MPPAGRWTDEHTLLCERCGYVIEGLPTEGACPECGKPIAESLPERRTGTPWQRQRTTFALVRTWQRTLRHPLRTFDTLRLDEVRLLGMVVPTLGLCSVAGLLVACALDLPELQNPLFFAVVVVIYAAVAAALALGLLVVSGATALALQVAAKLIPARGAPDAAWHAVGVASVGWVLTYAAWIAGWSAMKLHPVFVPPQTALEQRQQAIGDLELIGMPALLGGLGVGLAVFLACAGIGFYRLRFANAARAVETKR